MSAGERDVPRRFDEALQKLVAQVREDRSILAAILCGSLAHDVVWEKSDIDLVLVTIDDKKVSAAERALYADGLNVHAFLMPRAAFRKTVEGSLRNSFLHALLAKGRLLYTHDPTIAELCSDLGALGARDTELQLLSAATRALAPAYKARKWLLTRGDLDYCALWILYAAEAIARIEVLGAGLVADREVIPQATKLNPALFRTIYTDLLNAKKTESALSAALDALDDYLATRAPSLFKPVLDHLREVGEARSATEIGDHFARNLGVEGVTAACEYLVDQGLIGKASRLVQLTKKSTELVEELAFFHLAEGQDGR